MVVAVACEAAFASAKNSDVSFEDSVMFSVEPRSVAFPESRSRSFS